MAQNFLGVGAIRGDRGTPTKVVGNVPGSLLVFFSSKKGTKWHKHFWGVRAIRGDRGVPQPKFVRALPILYSFSLARRKEHECTKKFWGWGN